MGARIIVTETNPHRAFEALMDGCEVASMDEAAPRGDIFLTLTGNTRVIRKEHFEKMKDGVILGNAGHFDVEICKPDLNGLAVSSEAARPGVETFTMDDGRRIHLLGEGRLVNLAAAEGHPSAVMDMSFANQALASEWMVANGKSLERKVYSPPEHLDKEVARLKLHAMGVRIDVLTPEQEEYLNSWQLGT